ncbi:hypothetical protein R1sor_002784 [Riccia sorocarpa]|uniref:peptidyl-tRNA hydrolase n=1 Tax=Riccia sorocarpa TaxID=122646 RepID=A0ABD3H2F3_9MARC
MRALVQWPQHQAAAAGVMVRRPVRLLRLPKRLPGPQGIAPATVSLPSSPRCASSSPTDLSSHDSSQATSTVVTPEKRASPWLFVGLGNPGSKYQGTRHNVGFDMIDAIAQAEGISLSTIQFKALLGKGQADWRLPGAACETTNIYEFEW